MSIRDDMRTEFRTVSPDDRCAAVFEDYLRLGEDSPRRAQIAYDILSKARNYARLVRVARAIIRRGKPFITHLWVREDDVRKGDVVVMRAPEPQERSLKRKTKGHRTVTDRECRTSETSGQSEIANNHGLTEPAWDGKETQPKRWGTAGGAGKPAASERFDIKGASREYRKILEVTVHGGRKAGSQLIKT